MEKTTDSRCRIRERCGMALAIAAVACLSSVIVQWSKHFPEEEAVLEQTLFGDLADETTLRTSERQPLRQTAVLPDLEPLSKQSVSESRAVADSVAEPSVDSPEESALLIPSVRFTEPVIAEPSMIQPVSYSPTEAKSVSRLSGVIEEATPPAMTSPTAKSSNVVQLGKITFEE